MTGLSLVSPSVGYIQKWTKIVNDELGCFPAEKDVINLLCAYGENLKVLSLDDTGLFAFLIVPDFKGGLCLAEIMFYIRKENRGSLKLLKRYITEIEKIAIDNNCKTVKIGSNIGHKDLAFIRILKRWGYLEDSVSKEL